MSRRYYIPNYNRLNMDDDVYAKHEAKRKDAAYKELEDLAHSMLQIMDDNDIDVFQYSVRSPQRKRAFNIIAETKNDLD